MNIEIVNLDLNLIESDLQRLFTPYGEINNVQIVRDQLNNRSRGRAFINMPVQKEALNAILHLDGALLGNKKIAVSGVPDEEEQRSHNFNF